jgi:hypothetical protein
MIEAFIANLRDHGVIERFLGGDCRREKGDRE